MNKGRVLLGKSAVSIPGSMKWCRQYCRISIWRLTTAKICKTPWSTRMIMKSFLFLFLLLKRQINWPLKMEKF